MPDFPQLADDPPDRLQGAGARHQQGHRGGHPGADRLHRRGATSGRPSACRRTSSRPPGRRWPTRSSSGWSTPSRSQSVRPFPMTQPNFVPIVETDQVRPSYRLRTPTDWRARGGPARARGAARAGKLGRPAPIRAMPCCSRTASSRTRRLAGVNRKGRIEFDGQSFQHGRDASEFFLDADLHVAGPGHSPPMSTIAAPSCTIALARATPPRGRSAGRRPRTNQA